MRAALALALCLVAASPAVGAGDRGFGGCAARVGDRVVAEDNADRLFVPASVLKIVVSAAALHHLGPDHRAVTRVIAEGPLRAGALKGGLRVVGGGDPTWNARFFEQDPREPIRNLVDGLRQKGLGRVEGDLVIDASLFPGRPFPSSRSIDEVAFAFAAPTSAVAVDEGSMGFYIAPGKRPGDPAIARPSPADGAPPAFRWQNLMVTAPRERDGRGTVDFQPRWDSLELHLRGEYPVTEPPYTLRLAVPDGDLWAGEVIREALREAGIRIEGEVRVERYRSSPPVGTVLVELHSPPLLQWLPPILQESHNWYAEMLLRQLALSAGGEGRLDTGLDLLGDFLTETVGVDPGDFYLDDASGISPYNLITPRAVAAVLAWAEARPWFDDWLGTFPRSGTGTLESWPRLPANAVAKTGTLRHTLGLAGYARPAGGPPVAFACFLGHRPDPRPALRQELVTKIRAFVPPR